jgi:hypothetical protein
MCAHGGETHPQKPTLAATSHIQPFAETKKKKKLK